MKKSTSTVRDKPKAAAPETDQPKNSNHDFLIVAIGASAGGIEAFAELMRNLPPDTGMAFILIQHLDPKHRSILAEIIAKETAMIVAEVTNGMTVEPNHVYVIPPNASMSITNHTLQLGPRSESRGVHMATDYFMRSLAEDHGNRAIGVILSGSGSDGTLGLLEIQAQGGITFAQDETTAKYDGMPRSAIAAGCVDYVLPPKGIARELARIAQHPYVSHDRAADSAEAVTADTTSLATIFHILRRATGLDFTHYRQTTILRRIQRRMVVHKIDKLMQYVKYLQGNPAEVKALYQDMLINVTSFFRNPRVFEALKAQVFANILKNNAGQSAIRIWTPGCASGEETYSVAIALLESLEDKGTRVPIQIFGTDVSKAGIAKARTGVYPQNIEGDVSPDRLRRYFSKTEDGYRISKTIRDMCIFAQHNLLSDPPFSQMDLICCRNLLIYLEPVLQTKIISLFHYATRPGGYLVLGTSEGLGGAANLFATEDRADKIFSKKSSAARHVVSFSLNRQDEGAEPLAARMIGKPVEAAWNYIEVQREFDRRLLAQYSPAAVFLNEDLEILHTRGPINRYIELAPGRASLSILKMAREGLLLDLRKIISRARKENAPVKKQGVRIKSSDGEKGGAKNNGRLFSVEVVPVTLGNLKDIYFMVVFEESPQEHAKAVPRAPESHRRQTAKLEQELLATKEYLQSVIETHEATNEELQSANEEVLSTNEELQSTNEELETAKEELQSANEELSTVNDELRNRNVEITQINYDLINLLGSIDIGVVMVSGDFTIRRFTPKAQKLLGLIPADVGRSLQHFKPALEIVDFQKDVEKVMRTSEPVIRQLLDGKGGALQFRILPYRNADNNIDGAIITIVDLAAIAAAGSA